MSELVDGPDDDLSLPKATVTKLINSMMPSDVHCARETRDLLMECCVEFIHLVASEANEICEKDAKKTIAAEHVISALKGLGYEGFVSEVEGVLKDHKQAAKIAKQDRDKRTSKLENCGMSEEELVRQQQLLFEKARLNYQQSQASSSIAGTSAAGLVPQGLRGAPIRVQSPQSPDMAAFPVENSRGGSPHSPPSAVMSPAVRKRAEKLHLEGCRSPNDKPNADPNANTTASTGLSSQGDGPGTPEVGEETETFRMRPSGAVTSANQMSISALVNPEDL